MLAALTKGPAAYVPRSGWPAWAVLPAAVVIFVLAMLLGGVLMFLSGGFSGAGLPQALDPDNPSPQVMMQLAVWIAGLQVGLVVFTWVAAGFFGSSRRATLSLQPPAPGWAVLPWALLPLFAGAAVWTGILILWQPTAVIHDLRPFQELLQGPGWPIVLFVICIGAPVSEEFLFRGFLFSGLARTRLGLVGTALVTTLLWTALHAGYSAFGLLEVLGIGLYLSWVLVRTGSLWMTISCHAVYNAVVAIALLLIELPAAP